MTALPNGQTTRAVELAPAGVTRHTGTDGERGEPVDLAAIRDVRAAALLATGLAPQHWMALDADIRAVEMAGVEVTPEIVRRLAEARKATADEFVLRRATRDAYDEPEYKSVVYYVRLGNRIKIGYTSNLASRLGSICPEELLATEPGGRNLEAKRHEQFADLRVVGEWFRCEEPLVSWAAGLSGRDADA